MTIFQDLLLFLLSFLLYFISRFIHLFIFYLIQIQIDGFGGQSPPLINKQISIFNFKAMTGALLNVVCVSSGFSGSPSFCHVISEPVDFYFPFSLNMLFRSTKYCCPKHANYVCGFWGSINRFLRLKSQINNVLTIFSFLWNSRSCVTDLFLSADVKLLIDQ